MGNEKRISELEGTAIRVRENLLTSVYKSQAGHLGGALSWVDIGTVLYFEEMNLEGENPDRLILSKGHGVPAQYALLAEKGELDKEALETLRKIGSPLQGHPVVGTHPRIYTSTGALGQGLSVGIGYALANQFLGKKSRTYVLLGDGECQEGQIWEAVMSAPTLYKQGKLSRLVAIVDYNKGQGDGLIKDTMPSLSPLSEKWKSFGWYVREVDGHNVKELLEAYESARMKEDMPSVIVAHTKKGSGVSYMENDPVKWHGGSLDKELYEKAMEGLK